MHGTPDTLLDNIAVVFYMPINYYTPYMYSMCIARGGGVLIYMFSIGMCRGKDPSFSSWIRIEDPDPFFEVCPHL